VRVSPSAAKAHAALATSSRSTEASENGNRATTSSRYASHAELAAKQAQLGKAARDQELSRRQKEQPDKQARHAQIEQLIEQNRLPRAQTNERYNFVDGNKIRRIPVDPSVRERLSRGEIAIVRRDGGYELVPAETAARIRERDERAVIGCGVAR